MSQAEVIKKLKDDGYRMPKPQGLCTDSYYSMMLKCWNEDPIKRPTFDALFHYGKSKCSTKEIILCIFQRNLKMLSFKSKLTGK